MNEEVIGYAIEPHHWQHLRSISAELNNPSKHLDWDGRRDLANLIDLICTQAIPLTDPKET